ncbi:MAG: hypothetical protein LBD23_20450 [Oscillospiraceae bacterium]|jgi:hypothetical protein|nr:hypothetical protein [Oscillospiraceae bacterium]
MKQAQKKKMQHVIDKHINNRSFNARAVFLFGHCNTTEEMADYLISRDIKPHAILDNNNAKQGLTYCKIPIISPKKIYNYTIENSIVFIASRFFAEMSAQLRQLGYSGKIVQVVDYNSFTEYSLTDDAINRRTERVQRGEEALRQIRAKYPAQHLIICPNNALGDVYWAMAFLPTYIKRQGINDVSVVVTGNGCSQVAALFGIKNIIILDYNEMDEFVQAVIFINEDNCIIAHHDRPYTDNIILWLDKHFLSFIDYYKYAVYGLEKNATFTAPNNLEPFINHEQIPKGNAIILSPYSNSVVELPIAYWEELVIKYTKKGFYVYTNVANSEKPIDGTYPLEISITQIQSAVEYAGTFIGIRNGLCDVLYTARCRKIVVFPDCYYSTTPHKIADFFALPGWESVVIDRERY